MFNSLFTNTFPWSETIRVDQRHFIEQWLLAQTVQTAAVTFLSALQSAYIYTEMMTSTYSEALNQ